MAIIVIIKPMVMISPAKDILSTVPQYLQRFALELTIFPQLRHLICFTFLLKYSSILYLCEGNGIFYIPNIAFFSFGSSVCSPNQIEKTAFLNSNPAIVPLSSLFM